MPPSGSGLEALMRKSVAVLGFGSQGAAQAMNLRDSGVHVTVGLRPESASRAAAQEAGLAVADVHVAVADADVVVMLIPDERQPAAFDEDILPHLRAGAYVGFAHGLAVHFKKVVLPETVNAFLAAPRGPGRLIRRHYVEGTGFACSVAVASDPAGDSWAIARAYAHAIGASAGAIFETTFQEECEADLFGEQAILCGGLVELIRAGYDTLTQAGFSPEMAYFECLHEVKLIADLIYERGIAGMRRGISNTARFGGLTRGDRVIDERTREAMKSILADIQSGRFANELMEETRSGMAHMKSLQDAESQHPMEKVGERIRRALKG
jgi:ketol-acid reductoisomerase